MEVLSETLSSIQFRSVKSLGAPEVHKALPEAPETTQGAVGQELVRQGDTGIHPCRWRWIEDD